VCTLSWLDADDGYQIFFNRDERRTRKPARPPEARTGHRVMYLSPEDGDHGGSWIAANQHGLTLCLLNGFEATGYIEPAKPTSRGTVPQARISCTDAAQATGGLAELDLPRFRPFLLAAFDARGGKLLAGWSGEGLDTRVLETGDLPLVSSSFSTEQVRASRRAVFRRSAEAGETGRLAFHRGHDPARGPFSVCMHREDARTDSFTRVRVDRNAVELAYSPDSPCRRVPPIVVRLPRS